MQNTFLFFLMCTPILLSAQNGWLETTPVHQSVEVGPINGCEESGEPEIKYFRYKPERNYNVVINKSIAYRAKAPRGLENQNWSWSLTDISEAEEYELVTADDSPTQLVGFNSSGNGTPELLIKKNSLPIDNGKFGEQEIQAAHPTTQSITQVKNDNVVRSFFLKNEMNFFEPSEPNWFYYWSKTQPIVDLLNSISELVIYDVANGVCTTKTILVTPTLVYDESFDYEPENLLPIDLNDQNILATTNRIEPATGTWGGVVGPIPTKISASTYPACDHLGVGDKKLITGYSSIKISIGLGAGMSKPGDLQGYSAFYETVAHEINHAIFDIENYGENGISEDTDNDGYDDNWERGFSQNPLYSTYVAQGISFSVCNTPECDDSYQPEYSRIGCFETQTDGSITIRNSRRQYCNSGTLFEELFMNEMSEQLLLIAKPTLSNYDWSFDDKTFSVTVGTEEISVSTVNPNW